MALLKIHNVMNWPFDKPMVITAPNARTYLSLCRYAYKVRQQLRNACLRDVSVSTDSDTLEVSLVVRPYRKTRSVPEESRLVS